MSIKKEFIDKIKQHYMTFNPDTDKVIIKYKSDSDLETLNILKVYVKNKENKNLVGDWEYQNDLDFILKIFDESGVNYSWINSKMSGTIRYANTRLWIENVQCEMVNEFNSYIDDDIIEYGDEYEYQSNNDSWECNDERGAVMDEDELPYDVYDLNDDGMDSYDKLEKIETTPVIVTPSIVTSPTKTKTVKNKIKPKNKKPTQKKNGKKVKKVVTKTKPKKKIVSKKKVTPKKKTVKKKK